MHYHGTGHPTRHTAFDLSPGRLTRQGCPAPRADRAFLFAYMPMPDTIDTDRTQIIVSGPMSRTFAIHNPPPESAHTIGDAIESLPGGGCPWEAGDGTLSYEFDSRHQAQAARAYFASLFPHADVIE
jgi:hypothetical protein